MKHQQLNPHSQFLVIILILYASSLIAQKSSDCPASPYPVNVKQADGSSITIIGKGTMLHSWTETTDGYTIINKSGTYEYATKVNGQLVASGIPARNAQERKSTDIAFLQKQPKSLGRDLSIAQSPQLSPAASNKQIPLPFSATSTGNIRTLLLLIKYPDLGNTNTISDFNDLMNQPNYRGTGSFKDFFSTSSFGQLNPTTDVFGWYTAYNNYEYYGLNNGWLPSTELVREAVDAAEAAGVDFSKYDNDHDGIADGIMVAHAGPGAEEGSQGQYIWSHSWDLSVGGKQVTYDGVYIDHYTIQPERRLFLDDMVGIGVYCHEFGHTLGLPDLYDIDYSSAGVGDWSVMGTGGWLGYERSPANFCAWSRSVLGWITPTTLNTNGFYSLGPASINSQVYRINTQLSNEYFLLENRQRIGLDVALPGSGLAIYHINTNQGSNADEYMKLVDVEEADGQNDLDFNFNRGDEGDLFPGSWNNTSFNDVTNPNSRTYSDEPTNINISNISVDGSSNVQFSFTTTLTTYYRDADNDRYGDPNNKIQAHTAPDGYVTDHSDCDDADAAVHPGATEVCDNKDNNCNGQVDEGCNTGKLPKMHIYNSKVSESSGQAAVRLKLQRKSGQEIKVKYHTQDETAHAPYDYTASKGTVTFHAGEVEKYIYIKIKQDNTKEGKEVFRVELTDEENVTISGKRYAKVTIVKSGDHNTSSIVYNAKEEKDQLQQFSVVVAPNPATHYFVLNLASQSNESILVRVIDVTGRVVETRSGLAANSRIQFGQNYRPGMYITEVIQGSKKVTLKVIKLSN